MENFSFQAKNFSTDKSFEISVNFTAQTVTVAVDECEHNTHDFNFFCIDSDDAEKDATVKIMEWLNDSLSPTGEWVIGELPDYFINACKESYCGLFGESERNEDVILYKNGEVSVYSYSGNVSHRDDEILFIVSNKGQDAAEYFDSLRNFDEETTEELDRRGWFSIYEGVEEKPFSEWVESDRFELSDDDLLDWCNDLTRRFSEKLAEYRFALDLRGHDWNIR